MCIDEIEEEDFIAFTKKQIKKLYNIPEEILNSGINYKVQKIKNYIRCKAQIKPSGQGYMVSVWIVFRDYSANMYGIYLGNGINLSQEWISEMGAKVQDKKAYKQGYNKIVQEKIEKLNAQTQKKLNELKESEYEI